MCESKRHWERNFRKRVEGYRPPNEDGFSLSVKVGITSGCFHQEHSPAAYYEIFSYLNEVNPDCEFHEHESGPEVISWVDLASAGIAFAAGVIGLVAVIINARA